MANMPEDCPKIDPGAPKWVVTFGDLMSLLLCFFVLLLSFSETDRQKYKQVAGSMEKAFGVQRQHKVMMIPRGMKMIAKDFDQETIATRIKEVIGKQIEEEIVDYSKINKEDLEFLSDKDSITIRLMGESTFDSGKTLIKPRLKPLLLEISSLIKQAAGDIIVAGHTDNVPIRRGIYKSNLQLSIARAAVVAEFLLANSDINPKRISTMGFGEYRPIKSNKTAAGRKKNRRVEIIIGTIPNPNRP